MRTHSWQCRSITQLYPGILVPVSNSGCNSIKAPNAVENIFGCMFFKTENFNWNERKKECLLVKLGDETDAVNYFYPVKSLLIQQINKSRQRNRKKNEFSQNCARVPIMRADRKPNYVKLGKVNMSKIQRTCVYLDMDLD